MVPTPNYPGAEWSRRRNVQRRNSGAETAAPKRTRLYLTAYISESIEDVKFLLKSYNYTFKI